MLVDRVAQIFACPFCREMWSDDEGVTHCPDCDVDLLPLHELPPSAETVLEREAELAQVPEEWRKRSLFDLRRGRGGLLLLAMLGLFGFFQPWFVLRKPDELVLSGFLIARHFAGWVWAGAIGWFILIPLVLSRRSIVTMRGVRAVCALFASLTAGEILVLANVSPTSKVHVPIEFGWAWGLFFSASVSIIGTIVALGFGGSLPQRIDESDVGQVPTKGRTPAAMPQAMTPAKRSRRETLH
jgi:hypothetical protein